MMAEDCMKKNSDIENINIHKKSVSIYNFQWFLIVNILISIFMLLHMGKGYGASVHSLKWYFSIPVVIIVSSVVFLFFLKRVSEDKTLSTWRIINLYSLLLAVLWSGEFYVIIVATSSSIVFPIAIALIFSSLIPFFSFPLLLILFTFPITVVVFFTYIIANDAFSFSYCFSAFLIVFVIHSARKNLDKWFHVAIENEYKNKELLEKFKQLANTDPLTGLANRHHFNNYLEAVFNRESFNKNGLSIILLDVDFFKKYNDHYGHLAGDACLKSLATCLNGCIRRAYDLAGRYGGEEFIIVLPATSEADAIIVAERIKSKLALLALPHSKSTISTHVTVSQGISTWRPEMHVHDLIDCADKALYLTKHSGRNGYTCYVDDVNS
ncbi:diguanylate cyclase [Serratia proteamaculans]|uniref:GGDEF domain-containing protein n=1 Tax=Serratia proteamaculans TaxID=28151 RepID=UPI0015755412|nr:GGDEF domain-containing protein [Serratia proteamaculans]NTX77450.1 diguanylate cyclase [Serratia proteamaculans]NTZ28307.1 diguanylate cyclase [Serratia proteamaculans]